MMAGVNNPPPNCWTRCVERMGWPRDAPVVPVPFPSLRRGPALCVVRCRSFPGLLPLPSHSWDNFCVHDLPPQFCLAFYPI